MTTKAKRDACKRGWYTRRVRQALKEKKAGQREMKFSAPVEQKIPERKLSASDKVGFHASYEPGPTPVKEFSPDDIVVVKPTSKYVSFEHLTDHVAKVIKSYGARAVVQFITTPPNALCAGLVLELPVSELQPLVSFTNEGINNKNALLKICEILTKPSVVDPAPGGVIPVDDAVNHPKHYTSHPSGIECIEVTRHVNFNIGNTIKYLWRADHKNGLEDLKKAQWYLNDEIERVERLNNTAKV